MKMKKNRISILSCAIALLIGFFSAMAVGTVFHGDVFGSLDEYYVKSFSAVDLIIVFAVTVAVVVLVILVSKYSNSIARVFLARSREHYLPHAGFIAAFSAVLLVMWIPYMLSVFPGSVLGDSKDSISQILAESYHNRHPIAFTLLLGLFVNAGIKLGSINLGIFLFCIFQSIISAAAYSELLWLMYRKNVAWWFLIAGTLFFGLYITFPAYCMTLWKDPLFSSFLLLFTLKLFSIAESEGKEKTGDVIKLVLYALALAFMRHNGIIPLAVSAFVFFISRFRKKSAVKYVLIFACALTAIIQGPVFKRLGLSNPTVEALGLPLQQIGYVVSSDRDNLTEDQIDAVNQIISVDALVKAYTPGIVDSIKWNDEYKEDAIWSARTIMSAWLKLLPGHVSDYFKAYMLNTLGYWHPFFQNDYGLISKGAIVENSYGITRSDLLFRIAGLSLADAIDKAGVCIGSGTLAWIMLLSAAVCAQKREYKKLWLYLPPTVCWLSMLIGAPVAFSLRYVYILLIMFPIYLIGPFIQD